MSGGDLLGRLGAALLDAAITVDTGRQITGFNGHYRALLPRHQARKLHGSTCCQFIKLSVCSPESGGCLAARCAAGGQPLRFDEISATLTEPGPNQEALTVIASAAPLERDEVLVLLRDVSGAAGIQRKYKEMLEAADRAQEKLKAQLTRKTQALMDANTELNRVQQELMAHKKGLFG